MRACAGSYTPHGRSQCAWTVRVGLSNPSRMNIPPPSDGPTPETYHRGRKSFFGIGASVVVVAGVAWACLRWKPSRVRIEGGSMAPTLVPGDWALTIPLRHPKIGDVVVVEHPERPGYEMVKRLTAGPGDRVGERALDPD